AGGRDGVRTKVTAGRTALGNSENVSRAGRGYSGNGGAADALGIAATARRGGVSSDSASHATPDSAPNTLLWEYGVLSDFLSEIDIIGGQGWPGMVGSRSSLIIGELAGRSMCAVGRPAQNAVTHPCPDKESG
ncbi:MAG TPA: hypothetical protein VLZ30_00390, partial [Verrucomicrobiae bacterium]|nr:hypothetical protein [Verrucomicrobiae bacterium]